MIADQVPACETLADIGTDHAYFPIYAVKTRLCDRALAVDLKAGPLSRASSNIKRYGLQNHIEARHGNGLETVRFSECDVVVIAGMGGLLIRDILLSSVEKAKTANILLLQPNNAAEALRKWLYENGFTVICEKLTEDAGKIYCVIKSKWGGKANKKDEFTYYVGEKVFEGNELFIEKYLGKKLKDVEVIIEGRSRKRNNNKASPSSGYLECVSGAPGADDGGNDRHKAGTSGGTGRISEMSTETLICIRDKIKERMILL